MVCDKQLINQVKLALKEDIGRRDITSDLFIAKNKNASANIVVKKDCVICGIGIAGLVLKLQDKTIKFSAKVSDGNYVKKGRIIASIRGNTRSILAAERVVLNYLSLLSGIATKTRKYVQAVKPYKAKVLDTRKTLPGLRRLEKYAVVCGGGFNHRMQLDQMVLVKDNHIQALGKKFWQQGLGCLRSKVPSGMKIEIEVDNLQDFKKALKLKPDMILLDNMSVKDIKKAVLLRNSQTPKLEASGGVNLKNIKQVASTGVDLISVGSLTHSIESVDMSLEFI